MPGSNNIRILVVEDEPLLLELYARALAREHFDVAKAKDKMEAISKVEHFAPQVVLLDLMIPIGAQEFQTEYDHPAGFDVLEVVKRNPHTKTAKVIVLSCLDVDQHKAHAEELGADAYIVKSDIDPHELVDYAKKVLEKTDAR
jgi:DNA-binding response OmpR family regulator